MAYRRDPEKEVGRPLVSSIMGDSLAFENEIQVTQNIVPSTISNSIPSSRRSVGSIDTIDISFVDVPKTALNVDEETAGQQMTETHLVRTTTSIGTTGTGSRPPEFEIDFEQDDPENPVNWPIWYRGIVIVTISFSTWTTVFYSTSYTSSMPGMMKEFHINSEVLTTTGVTFYLLGLAFGSMLLAPASEIYGRRPVYMVALFLFSVLVIPAALATSLPEVIIVRFFGAICGAAMIANAPGTISDISDAKHRALAFSIWSIGPMNGPVTGPLIGGFTDQYLGWRWTNWLVLIFGCFAWITTSLIKETYAPVILKRKAAQKRKETGDDRWWCRYDESISVRETLKINLSRPFIMTAMEPILWFWDLYIGVIYGILYLCFVAYPLIFGDIRGWSPGLTGLAFAGVGLGTMLTIASEPLIRRMIESHSPDPETGKPSPEASVSAICIAAILAPVGQLIFSWTSVPTSIHWIWCILAGIPFGAGNTLVFIYSTSYLSGCYGIYTASALAGNAIVRSVIGGTLPLVGPAMYASLTPQWAGTLLGLLEVALIPIPFVFYRYGKQIRERSPIIKRMREDQERIEKNMRRHARLQGRATIVDLEAEATEQLGTRIGKIEKT